MNRIQDIALRLKAQTDTEKQQSTALNTTRFESDLVSAINGEKDISRYQSSRGKQIALLCVADMNSKFGGVKKAVLISNEGGNGSSVLSPIYKKFMCADGARCSGDPKADIIMSTQMHGKMQISVKKEGSAQVATAQAGEANAVISAALGKDKRIISTVREIITQTLSKKSYYAIRDNYAVQHGVDPEDFDKTLSKMIGLRTKASRPSASEIQEFNSFLNTIGIKEQITSSLRDYMASPYARRSIFKEFASGEKRYTAVESRRRADWFMTWNESGRIQIEEIEDFINANIGSFRMNIRDRGNQSGGSLRIDIRESNDFLEIEKQMLEEFDMFCLTEGVLDTTVSLMRSAGKQVASLYKLFVSAVKSLVSFISALFASGTATILEFFGLQTTELSYSW
jgi:hypothetical protein